MTKSFDQSLRKTQLPSYQISLQLGNAQPHESLQKAKEQLQMPQYLRSSFKRSP